MILKMFKVGREFSRLKEAHNVVLLPITEGEEDVDLEKGSSIGETALEDVEGPPFS